MEKPKLKELFTFDHSQDSLSDAIGMSREEKDELAIKMATVFKDFYTHGSSQSQIIEQICELFTIKEIIFMASMHVFSLIEEFGKRNPQVSLLKTISDMSKAMGKEMPGDGGGPGITPEKIEFVKKIFDRWKDEKETEKPKPYIKSED